MRMNEKRYTKSEVVEALLNEAARYEGLTEVMIAERDECEEYHDCTDGTFIPLDDETIEKFERWMVTLREVANEIKYGKILR